MAGRATVGEQLVRRFAGVEILRGRKRCRQHDACCSNSPKTHQRRDDLAPRSNERSQCRPLARGSRSRRQQLIELGRSIGFAILIGDDDPPAFARPNLRLRHDEQPALAGKTALLVIAFCDHFIGQCASPCVALHPFSSWQRALAAIRRERGNLVPSAAALCAGTGSSRATEVTTPHHQRDSACRELCSPPCPQPRRPMIRAAAASGQAAWCYANPYAVQGRQPGAGPSPPRRSRSCPAIPSVDADDVWPAEIDQPLHGR